MTKQQLLLDLYAAISAGKTGDALARFFTADAQQVEYPSLMRPAGSTRGIAAMLEAADQGTGAIVDQRYDLHTFLEQGERAAVQFTWSGRCAIDLGPLPGGTRLTAHIAAFYEFEHGLVKRQSSYDCYEPIAPTGVVTAT
jgi:hypothetical protein